MSDKRISCVIFWNNKKYEKMVKNAAASFAHFHPDIRLRVVDEKILKDMLWCGQYEKVAPGIMKMMVALELYNKHKEDKIIVLGADTITCGRLDEFIDNDEDILASLDYPYQLIVDNMWVSPNSETHLNADVVCFNNKNAMVDIIANAFNYKEYFEQGSLNEAVWKSSKYTYKIVDSPYKDTKVLYNVRSKGNIVAKAGTKPWAEHTLKFKVVDNKLYTGNGKQIKVWHYCEGYSNLSTETVEKMMYDWSINFFNKETVEFFKSIGCKEYF